jgi:hypothetical protein
LLGEAEEIHKNTRGWSLGLNLDKKIASIFGIKGLFWLSHCCNSIHQCAVIHIIISLSPSFNGWDEIWIIQKMEHYSSLKLYEDFTHVICSDLIYLRETASGKHCTGG